MNCEMCRKIEQTLEEAGICSYVYQDSNYPDCVYLVTIEMGDWKHEHLRAKLLLERDYEAVHVNTNAIENGTDTYSATHAFLIHEKGEL